MTEITLQDLMTQENKRDIIGFATRLREAGSIHPFFGFAGMERAWLVTPYEDVMAVLKDPRFFKDPLKLAPTPQREQVSDEGETSILNSILAYRRDMLVSDPPDHTRLRGLVSRAFTPRIIDQLRPRVQQLADELLDAVQDKGQMDLITDFAFPLPMTVISEMLGIPAEDRPQFRAWSQTMITGAVGDDPSKVEAAMQTFVQYIKSLLAEKDAHPGPDLTSGLVQVEHEGDHLSEMELISTIFLLIVAGHETTVNLLGNGMLALFQHPEQMKLLREKPDLMVSAIEELLRYTAPVSMSSPRWASEDLFLGNQLIRKGEMVFVSLVGANTDPQQFPHPTELDVERQEHQHVAFGKGIHFCLGAPLARLEGQIAVGTLLRRLPNLHLVSDPAQLTWTSSPLLRGLASLPVAF